MDYSAPVSVLRTLRLKVRSEGYAWLNAAAVEANQVFNYCNETSLKAATRTDRKRKLLSGFDLCNLTAGASPYFEKIGADTIQSICVHCAQKRRAALRLKLRWRVSRGSMDASFLRKARFSAKTRPQAPGQAYSSQGRALPGRCLAQILKANSRSVSEDGCGRRKQPQAGPHSDGKIRAGFGLGDAQKVPGIQSQTGGQKL